MATFGHARSVSHHVVSESEASTVGLLSKIKFPKTLWEVGKLKSDFLIRF